jgi:hypothetical protein
MVFFKEERRKKARKEMGKLIEGVAGEGEEGIGMTVNRTGEEKQPNWSLHTALPRDHDWAHYMRLHTGRPTTCQIHVNLENVSQRA